MKKIIIFTLLFTFICSLSYAKKRQNSDKTQVTVTFLVMMDKNANSKIPAAIKEQDGILESKIDTNKQEVVITFDGEKNTVSNLQKMFKDIGYTANALEVGCFGSPEGCLNATHPIPNSMP